MAEAAQANLASLAKMMTEPATWRVAVSGSGPVSLAFALFLERRGIAPERIALAAPAPVPPGLARRPIAISHGSRQLLERITHFPDGGRIGRVEVSIAGHAGRTRIGGEDLATPSLGHVVRYGALLDALRASAAVLHHATDTTPAAVVVHADGDPGEDAHERAFDQCALLGEVTTPQSPDACADTAYERFTANGPLALLPLPESRRRALVWCDTAARCEARRGMDPETLSRELSAAFGATLGALRVDGPAWVAPLTRRLRRQADAPGEVWIGNAAQVLHPVAGQGLNLGLRDAFELAEMLADADRLGTPVDRALAAYRQRRRTDRGFTVALTDLMAASFTWPLVRPLQSPLLAALDLLPALRRPLAAQLMFGWRA